MATYYENINTGFKKNIVFAVELYGRVHAVKKNGDIIHDYWFKFNVNRFITEGYWAEISEREALLKLDDLYFTPASKDNIWPLTRYIQLKNGKFECVFYDGSINSYHPDPAKTLVYLESCGRKIKKVSKEELGLEEAPKLPNIWIQEGEHRYYLMAGNRENKVFLEHLDAKWLLEEKGFRTDWANWSDDDRFLSMRKDKEFPESNICDDIKKIVEKGTVVTFDYHSPIGLMPPNFIGELL